MAATPEDNLTGFRNTLQSNNNCYTAIKVQYTGSWMDDINNISKLVGIPTTTLLQLNPWLINNKFVANNHDYVIIQISSGSVSVSGNNQNTVVDGYYATNSWVFPLGVGSWYCSTGYKNSHKAIDLTTGTPGQIQGAPIYAAKAGTVVQSYKSDSWGNTILIRHDDTKDSDGNCYYTRYAHMEALASQAVGSKVSQGDKIGNVGNTGRSTGYHLHFQIYFTSATRTDYTNFNAAADFSVNPNNIPDFPGIPWNEGKYTTVNYTKSTLVTNDMLETINKAITGDATKNEIDKVINDLTNAIINDKGVEPNSNLAKIIKDFVNSQINSIIDNGLQSVNDLLNGGNFEQVWNNFAQTVVDNAINYVSNKINGIIQQAIDGVISIADQQVTKAKSSLKNWIFQTTHLDPNSDTAQALGTYLDGYVDAIITNGWSALRTAISTGDVKNAAKVFLTQTKNLSIDYLTNITMHGLATAITAYIPTIIDDPEVSNVAVSLAIGISNTLIQSVGQVIKGDISLEQAGKNVIASLVTTGVSVGIKYATPVISNWVMTGINVILDAAGITLGPATGGVSLVVTTLVSSVLNWVGNKLLGWLFS